jgi:hypothetical protein
MIKFWRKKNRVPPHRATSADTIWRGRGDIKTEEKKNGECERKKKRKLKERQVKI